MSRTKERKKVRKNEQRNRNTIIGIVSGLVVVILGLLVIQSQTQRPSGLDAANTERSRWQTLPLTDARTGETFTLADFEEKNVFVKIMSPF